MTICTYLCLELLAKTMIKSVLISQKFRRYCRMDDSVLEHLPAQPSENYKAKM